MLIPAQSALSLARPHSLEHVFVCHADSVYRFLCARVGNQEDAEDLTSQVFLKATRQLDGARSEASEEKLVQRHTPTRQVVFWVSLAVAAALWLLLLPATHFNSVTVSLGLLVVVGVIR